MTLPVRYYFASRKSYLSMPGDQFELCVIAKAGFGQDVKWNDDELPPPGRQFTFKQALFKITPNIYLPLVLPDWAWGLRKQWKDAKRAFDEVKVSSQSAQKGHITDNGVDLFSRDHCLAS